MLLLALVGCRTTPEAPVVHQEINALNAAMERRLQQGDLRGVASFYADDAILLSPAGERHEGREAIDAYWEGLRDPVDWSLTVDELEGSGALVVQRGTSRLTTRRGDAERVSTADFVLIWVRQADGMWRIAVDAWWSPPPETR